jgi:hypothetical protein
VARSQDGGARFTEEVLLSEEPSPIADPALVRVSDGGWRMYFSEGADIVSAFAVAPLGPFVREAGARLTGQGGSPGALRVGGITHLLTCVGGVLRADCPDGLSFTPGETPVSPPPGYDLRRAFFPRAGGGGRRAAGHSPSSSSRAGSATSGA